MDSLNRRFLKLEKKMHSDKTKNQNAGPTENDVVPRLGLLWRLKVQLKLSFYTVYINKHINTIWWFYTKHKQ